MGYVRHPAGPLPARVYWFRRIVVLLAFALAIGLVVAVVSRIGADASDGEPGGGTGSTATEDSASGDDPDSGGADSDDADSDGADEPGSATGDADSGDEGSDADSGDADDGDAAKPATDADTGGARECVAGDVEVRLASDATSYAAGKDPTFAVEVSLVGEEPCLVDVNDATRELVIVSGPAHVWSSAECVEPEPRLLLLGPGQVDSQAIRWTRNRTDAACTPGLPDALPGTYRATVTLLGEQTDELVFTLG